MLGGGRCAGLVVAFEDGPDGFFGFAVDVAFAEEADDEAAVEAAGAEVVAEEVDAVAHFEDDGEEEFPFGRGAGDTDAIAGGADAGVPEGGDFDGFEGVVAAVEDGFGEDEDGDAVAHELETSGGEVGSASPVRLDAEHGGEGFDDIGVGDEFEVGGLGGEALESEGGAADEGPGGAIGGFLDDVDERPQDGVRTFLWVLIAQGTGLSAAPWWAISFGLRCVLVRGVCEGWC